MSDFTAEDLFDAIDRIVRDLLEREGIEEPPVDAVALAQHAFHLTVTEAEEEGEPQYGDRPPRRRSKEIVLRMEQSEAGRNAVCARACAKELLPTLLTKLGVAPGTENRSAQTSLIATVVPRLLLPSKWFEKDARRAGFDLFEIKERYSTATYEMIALRLLDLDEPIVIAIVDDGAVATRRGNRSQAGRTLTPAESGCIEKVVAAREPQTLRRDGWTARGWPIPGGPFNRIILRSVPDDI